MSSHEKALLKLLHRHGYDCSTNLFGVRTFTRDGCTPVELLPRTFPDVCKRLTALVVAENRKHVEPESVWVRDERRRAEAQALREAADAARVRDTRLGGLSRVLTEPEVDAVARRAEHDFAERRRMDRLMRELPLGASRKG